MTTTDRAADTDRFYGLLAVLGAHVGGPRHLAESSSAGWPSHGIYFFFEGGELRADGTPRVVRVGTHALTATSGTTLWHRLAQHRGPVGGSSPGGGNHRGSIFRDHVGRAMLNGGGWDPAIATTWRSSQADAEARRAESPLERAVSAHIRQMPFLWLEVRDRQLRGAIERNSIALLSRRTGGIDRPSDGWLGLQADNEKVRTSGLWNVNHVDEGCDPEFLDALEDLVAGMGR